MCCDKGKGNVII